MAATSEPSSGSDIEKAPRTSPVAIRGRNRCFCSSVPCWRIMYATMKWVLMHAGHAHPAAGQLLDAQRVGEQRFPEPAVLLGDHQPEQPHLAHLVDDPLRIRVGVLEFLGGRE